MSAPAVSCRDFVYVRLSLRSKRNLILPRFHFKQANADLHRVDVQPEIDDALGRVRAQAVTFKLFLRYERDGKLFFRLETQFLQDFHVELRPRARLLFIRFVRDPLHVGSRIGAKRGGAEGIAVYVGMRKRARIGNHTRQQRVCNILIVRNAQFGDQLGYVFAVACPIAHEIVLRVTRIGNVVVDVEGDRFFCVCKIIGLQRSDARVIARIDEHARLRRERRLRFDLLRAR